MAFDSVEYGAPLTVEVPELAPISEVDLLRHARELIATGHWTRCTLAQTQEGFETRVYETNADRFCAVGSLQRAHFNYTGKKLTENPAGRRTYLRALKRLARGVTCLRRRLDDAAPPRSRVTRYNDDQVSSEEVIAWFDRVIEGAHHE